MKSFCPSKHSFLLEIAEGFACWNVEAMVWVYSTTNPEQTRIEIGTVTDSFGDVVDNKTINAFFAEISAEAEKLVDQWYTDFINSDDDGNPFADYADKLAHMRDAGEDPRHYTDSLPEIPGVPRSVRVDSHVPCVPGTAGYPYL